MENSGSKSFQNLIAMVYNPKTGSGATYLSGYHRSDIILLSFLRSGYYSDSLAFRETGGFYWSLRILSDTGVDGFGFLSTNIVPQGSYARGYGFPIRCLAR